MIKPETKLQNLPRVQSSYLKPLNKLGLVTVEDLLRHLPFRYEDYSDIAPIDSLSASQVATVIGQIAKTKNIRSWKKRISINEIFLTDDSGSIRAVWFNQPYLTDSLKEGREVRLSGKVSAGKKDGEIFFSNPAWEFSRRDPTNTGRLVPIYPETDGLSSRWIRWQISLLFKAGIELPDPLPKELLEKLHLPSLMQAFRDIHFPKDENAYLVARKRFAFEEMLLMQLKSLLVRQKWESDAAVEIDLDHITIKKFVASLPYTLTGAQSRAISDIFKDLQLSRPMNRLLNGDVGSGKTVVAALAAFSVANSGFQSAILAPTEVLARQHFENFRNFFPKNNPRIGLITNAYKSIGGKEVTRPEFLKALASGNLDIIIGTHALIQSDIRFHNLAFIVVDEQHRFGVAQRAYLQQEAEKINDGLRLCVPHFLTMTATPIPRTLALAFFGNLDISLLDELPKSRKPIQTKVVKPSEREKMYTFIRQQITAGRQAFVILPLVEDSKILTEVKAATSEHKRLSAEVFPELELGLLHGRLKSDEKESVMRDFKSGKTNILVSTSVVEVGVDVPNATVILIEDADRFGLSQIHQFRGRVGRGTHQSYCFLLSNSSSETATKRLRVLAENTDGFKIAEKDLELRGPGEFFGTQQSGLPDIAMENLTNVKLITIAREEAQAILENDPELKKNPFLQRGLKKFETKIHLE